MNAESEITSSLAALPGLEKSRRDRLEALATRTCDRTPQPNEAGHPKRFAPQSGAVASDVVPWPVRPRFSRIRRSCFETATQLSHSRLMWTGAGLIAAAALTRGAMQLGLQSGPVIVHLVWPV